MKGLLAMAVKPLKVSRLASDLGYNKILTFRPDGKNARKYIQDEIARVQPGDVIELDFSGIDLCDASFVDEMVIEVQRYLRKLSTGIVMFISNMNDSTMDNLRAALAFRELNGERIPILYHKGKSFSYVGSLEPVLDEAFKKLIDNKQITARDLARTDKISINSASNKLKKLYDYRLIVRNEVVDQTGKQYIYSLPK